MAEGIVRVWAMTGAGSTDLKRHMAGETLTLAQAVRAKCADCCGNYADGRNDCGLKECPLYPYHVYNPARRHFRQGKSQADMIAPTEGDMGEIAALEAMP